MLTKFKMFFFSTLIICSQFVWAVTGSEEIPKNLLDYYTDTYKENNKTYLAITFNNHEGWHTYWTNPGDAGLPIKIELKIGDKKEIYPLKALELPIPKKYRETGDQIGFGYSGTYTYFYEFDHAKLKKHNNKNYELKISWLICKNVCVPGEKIDLGEIKNLEFLSLRSSRPAPLDSEILKAKKDLLPKIEPIPAYLSVKLIKAKEENRLELRAEIDRAVDQSKIFDNNLILTYPLSPFDFEHEYFLAAPNKFMAVTPVSWDGEYSEPPIEFPKNGKFKKPYTLKALFYDPIAKRTYIIEKKFDSFDLNYSEIPTSFKKLEYKSNTPIKIILNENKKSEKREESSLFYYILFGFLGGLILNIMPCVLPVISLKLFELIKYRQESRKSILRHNLFYTLGILSTFVVFAFIIIGLKSIGSNVGWGFQLQSPIFISIMILALFIFSLNLFGMFEFSTPGGKHLGNIKTDSPFIGDFLSGVLATILSTPCSAPFLGTALTFAFSSSLFEILVVFLSIGLGLSSPFLLTGFFPRVVHLFPKPGMWMITFKKFMGLSLILTIIWLLDVYTALAPTSLLVTKLLILLTLIFSIFFFSKSNLIKYVFISLSLLLTINIWYELKTTKSSQTESISITNSELDWIKWSPEKMQELKNSQDLVFMDFTAKWCFTCKVNEKLVLDTNEFRALVKENNLKLLLADWTKRDEIIAKFLNEQGLVGVPAYFIQKKDGTLINLGETISIDKIRKNLNE